MIDLAAFLKSVEGIRDATYLASPYYHKDPKIVEQRFKEVYDIVYRNVDSTLAYETNLISPVVITHPMAQQGLKMPKEGWYKYCLSYLIDIKKKKPRVDRFAILCSEGWEESVGIGIEKAVAESHGITISYIHP